MFTALINRQKFGMYHICNPSSAFKQYIPLSCTWDIALNIAFPHPEWYHDLSCSSHCSAVLQFVTYKGVCNIIMSALNVALKNYKSAPCQHSLV